MSAKDIGSDRQRKGVLLSSDSGILASALCFNYSEGLSVIGK
jgi:hypothetical protein